jgi:hypothetical protein
VSQRDWGDGPRAEARAIELADKVRDMCRKLEAEGKK